MTDDGFYRALLRSYIDSANDGIFVLCDEMKFHVVNPLLQSWLGTTETCLTEHNCRRPITDFIGDEENCRVFSLHFAKALHGQPVRFECFVQPEGSVPRWMEIGLSKVDLEAGDMIIGIARDITDKKRTEALIWHQANFDSLTGLANRQMFQDRAERELKKAQHAGLQVALMIIDLDGFKEVNDTLGHETGDQLLQAVVPRLLSCVSDADTVARLGGDEFSIVLGELNSLDSVERIAQNLLANLSEAIELGRERVHISASIGIAIYPNDAKNFTELMKSADQAMYAAKREGRNRCIFYAPSMQEAMQARVRLISDLRSALNELSEDQPFHLVYQPIVALDSGAIHKAEALIRWRHPSRGIIYPTEFIPIAENTGMIVDIGSWVFRDTINTLQGWRDVAPQGFQVSINVSPLQIHLMADIQHWLDELDERQLPGSGLVVEITEGLLLDAITATKDKLLALQAAGMEISLDDFGTGYSSLAYLRKFKIDSIKIDQSFVRNLTLDSDEMILCEAMIAMAHKLGMKVIAEGVETTGQRDLLLAAGCDYGQGHLFSRPVSADDFGFLLRQAVRLGHHSADSSSASFSLS